MKISKIFPDWEKLDQFGPRIEVNDDITFFNGKSDRSYLLTYSVDFSLTEAEFKKMLED